MRQRWWLWVPVAILYSGDIGLTLCGQPSAYWAGDYQTALEANPLADRLLKINPWLFSSGAALWLLLMTLVIRFWQSRWAVWSAIIMAMGHAVGGSTWLVKFNTWGLLFAIAYLVFAAQATSWCWRRYERAQQL